MVGPKVRTVFSNYNNTQICDDLFIDRKLPWTIQFGIREFFGGDMNPVLVFKKFEMATAA